MVKVRQNAANSPFEIHHLRARGQRAVGNGSGQRQAARTENPYCSADVSFITLSTYRRYHGLRDHRSSVSSLDTAR